jgi:hypothetical protein
LPPGVVDSTTEGIRALPEPTREIVLQVWVNGFQKAFLYAMPIIGVGFLIALFLKRIQV